MNPKQKQNLVELQLMAQGFNSRLVKEFGETMFKEGGDLFLGRYYGESDKIYFGINPGSTGRDEDPFKVCLESRNGFNPPFRHEGSDIGYWKRWKTFLSKHHDLDEWFNGRVTSTFLSPWRTENFRKLKKLNGDSKGELYKLSSQLLWKMLEDHNAKILIVAGLDGVHLFNELIKLGGGKPAWNYKDVNAVGKGKGKRYAKHEILEKGITVLQVPHFSRWLPSQTLESLAVWLRVQLRSFGL